MHSVRNILPCICGRNTGSIFGNTPRNNVKRVRVHLWIERRALGAVRRGLPLIPGGRGRSRGGGGGNLKIMKIHKYAWNANTNTLRKTKNTQIQKYIYPQIQILPLALYLDQRRRKICQIKPLPQGKLPPSKVAKNIFLWVKMVWSIILLGDSTFFGSLWVSTVFVCLLRVLCGLCELPRVALSCIHQVQVILSNCCCLWCGLSENLNTGVARSKQSFLQELLSHLIK